MNEGETPNLWQNQRTVQLVQVLVSITDPAIMQNFLRDVMTQKEITEISARLRAAQMLQSGATYSAVIADTKLSSRTVARISDWIKNGRQGYQAAAAILNATANHPGHLPPARAK